MAEQSQINHPAPFKHIMLDLETLGSRPGSVIVSIGAVAFDPHAGVLGPEFERVIDPVSAQACGLRIDASTVVWWMGQGDAARRKSFSPDAAQLPYAILDFTAWLKEVAPGQRRIWGHGATFDPVLLDSAYHACRQPPPWGHRDARDTRTVFDLAGIGVSLEAYREPGDTLHDALADARAQARAVSDAYRKLGLSSAATETGEG